MAGQNKAGRVIWITGLSGAGKSSLARELLKRLPGAILLDGDELREVLGLSHCAFDAKSRSELGMKYARLARLLAAQGFTVLVATISLFHKIHEWNRHNQPHYLEIFLDVPEEVRRKRDPKSLYRREDLGEVKEMAGGKTPVELPLNPHLKFTGTEDLAEMAEKVLANIQAEPCA